jgi:ubiquinone/menaquinone biosynthesis C-methylase UbiE
LDDVIRRHYELSAERERLVTGVGRLEFARTKELIERYLPRPPARVLDVGGGPGLYAAWLAERGYEVDLIDPVPLHVDQAVELSGGSFTAAAGDALSLDEPDGSADAVLLLGPLYHLTERSDRITALTEAARVLRSGGVVLVAAISRFASLLDGLVRRFLDDADFAAIVARDLRDGQHRNPYSEGRWFTTAFFHHPDELTDEITAAGLETEGIFGVEGPGGFLLDFDQRWNDPSRREQLMYAARMVEQEPTLLGLSWHLLAVGRPIPLGGEGERLPQRRMRHPGS